MKVRCPTCNGTGVIEGEGGIYCYSCMGEGVINKSILEQLCYPVSNQRAVFGLLMITTLLIGLMLSGQAKLKVIFFVLYVYLWGSFAFAGAKILAFFSWVKSGFVGKAA